MLIVLVIIACLGWVLGVHLPWFIILGIWILMGICIYKTSEGLEGMPQVFAILCFIAPMVLSGFTYGNVTFVDMGETINYLFTGG